MRVVRIYADLHVSDIGAAREFYAEYLGLSEESIPLDWVRRFADPANGVSLQLVTEDATAAENPVVSVKVEDVDSAYAEARERGYEIVHPLTVEEWGVRRFLVRAPDGNVLNIVAQAPGDPS
jgi:predicted enzyme related to lactoylglutathione lyase